MQSIRMKMVLALILSVFLLGFSESGYAAEKTSVKTNKSATATFVKLAAETAKNGKTELKQYREAWLVQQLLDKIIATGVRLNKDSRSNATGTAPQRKGLFELPHGWVMDPEKFGDIVEFRNQLAQDLVVLTGGTIVIRVNPDTLVAGQMEIDLGTVEMPEMPSFQVPVEGLRCSRADPKCLNDEPDKTKNDNIRLTVVNNVEGWIVQLTDYLNMINEGIDMRNPSQEFNTDLIDFYNNAMDMTQQMILEQ